MAEFDAKLFLERVGEGKTITAHKAGAVIFEQGSKANAVYYLQSGKAKESVTRRDKDAVVGIVEPGRFFGTSSLHGSRRQTTVTAITDCIVTRITNEAVNAALRHQSFAQLFMAYLLHRNSTMKADKIDLLLHRHEKLLAQTLLMLAHFGEGQTPQTIGPEITQEMLAEMISSSRQRVNFFLNRFRNLGYIRYNDEGITVLPGLLKIDGKSEIDITGD